MIVLSSSIGLLNRSFKIYRFSPLFIDNRLYSSSHTNFFEKNAALKRPLSPFTNYQIEITSALSITHRFTGLGISFLVYGFGISQLITSSSITQQIEFINSIPAISLVKFLAITAFNYHLFNGIRHLCWDMGIGFKLKELYLSGYVVLVLTLLTSFAAAFKMSY